MNDMRVQEGEDTRQPPIAVVGLGRSGVAAARFLAARGERVFACDENLHVAGAGALSAQPGIELHLGPLPAERLRACREILLSPGIPRSHPALAGSNPINDVEWLYRVTREQTPVPEFIGITGSNGKSTVTTLVGDMVIAGGIAGAVGGNLGDAALSLWRPGVALYTLELSSFQLESTDRFHPRVAVMLNLTPDHMDRYADAAAYLAAKARLFDRQRAGDVAVLNAEDPTLAVLQRELTQRGVTVIPFAIERPLPGGVYVADGWLVDHRAATAQRLIEVTRIAMAGRHNQANAAAAAAAALASGVSAMAVARVLAEFKGLAHRMELVRTLDGIRYYNDSKGTNVGAVVASLGSFDRDVVLIAGGRDKNSDFAPLAEQARGRVTAVVLIGEAADDLARVLGKVTRVLRAASMVQAVRMARNCVRPGGVVLLSPACASFDMFRNFEDRGEKFREAVHGI
ncbi:MAG: UDP-N-acetylmuramoyl-L-alanine--D-glutamate ligase [Magnetococcales bacterium]|nr:UDP-N-acetylmuramoyl-L-alanine--D-glutamate ligase [Magnetococcales bacterium]